jgi:hypothetical protein
MKTTRIVIFAKAPIPGFAKTRLIPALGADGAAALARQMLETTIANALAANVGPVELCVTPEIDDPVWRLFPLPHNIEYSSQGEGDLGARMARAAERVIARGESVLLIGADVPELSAERLRHAAMLLHNADATLFPTADGGYALLGLNRFHHLLFECIPWSTDVVAFSTLCRLGRLGWSVRNGPMLHDVDEPGDLKWLTTAMAASNQPLSLPTTA